MKTDLIRFIFDRSPSAGEWFFQEGHEDPEMSNEERVEFSESVFRNISGFATNFTDDQLALGLRYLVNPSCGPFAYSYIDASVPVESRVRAIKQMTNVFREVFAVRCAPILIHSRSDSTTPSPAINLICYMWWDTFPRHGIPYSSQLAPIDEAILSVIKETLQIPSLACQESALHGLGHWHAAMPDRVNETIRGGASARFSELAAYAAAAESGAVQ